MPKINESPLYHGYYSIHGYIPITLDYFNPLETLKYKDNKSYNIEINTVTSYVKLCSG